MTLTVEVKTQEPVSFLRAEMGVRYWEDAKVNGVDDSDEDPKVPLKSGDMWRLTIGLESGRVRDWPKGVTADVHYKVCDDGVYTLLNHVNEEVLKRDGYVPSMLSPNGDGYGDYVIMKIDGEGQIENWQPDLSYFDEEDY